MSSGQSQQAVKAREYTWPVPRPQLHLLLAGKFHSLGSRLFFLLGNYMGDREVTVPQNKHLQLLQLPLERSLILWGLDVLKEKTPPAFEYFMMNVTTVKTEENKTCQQYQGLSPSEK